MTIRTAIFTALFLWTNSLSGQLEWAVRPLLDTPYFYTSADKCDRFIIVGERGGSKRVMRYDGSFAFGGQSFKQIDFIGANCFYSGKDLEGRQIAFTADEWMITDDYDAVDQYAQTTLVLVEKGELFGLVNLNGEVALPLGYESICRLKVGRFQVVLPDGEERILEVPETRIHDAGNRAAVQKLYAGLLTDREIFREEVEHKTRKWFWGIRKNDGEVLLQANRYLGLKGVTLEGHRFITCRDGVDGKVGALDSTGQVTIPFIYDEITSRAIGDKYLVGHRNDTAFIFNWRGEVHSSIATKKLHPLMRNDLLTARIDGGVILLNQDLEPVLQDTFNEIYTSSPDKVFLKKGGLRGFYSVKTGLYTAPRFKKVGGPYARAALPVAEKSEIGFYDVHTGEMLTPFIYNEAKGLGGMYKADVLRVDTIVKAGRSFNKRYRDNYLLDVRGNPVIGPTPRSIKHVTGAIYQERWSKDTVMLYDFKKETSRMITGSEVKVGPQITRRAADDFVLTIELAREQDPRSFTSLLTLKNTRVIIYQENEKYGLMTIDKRLTEPRFSTIEAFIPREGVKVEIDGKWGLLRLPKAYQINN
jgi:hypothetical protein